MFCSLLLKICSHIASACFQQMSRMGSLATRDGVYTELLRFQELGSTSVHGRKRALCTARIVLVLV